MTDTPFTLDRTHNRQAMAAHLRRMADALDAGAPVVSGGLVATDALSLSGDLVLGEPPATSPMAKVAEGLRAKAEGEALENFELDQACIRRARELGDHWEHMGPVARDRLRRIVLEEQAAAGFGVVR